MEIVDPRVREHCTWIRCARVCQDERRWCCEKVYQNLRATQQSQYRTKLTTGRLTDLQKDATMSAFNRNYRSLWGDLPLPYLTAFWLPLCPSSSVLNTNGPSTATKRSPGWNWSARWSISSPAAARVATIEQLPLPMPNRRFNCPQYLE